MPDLITWVLTAIALAGHAVLVLAFVNRTHAYGWNRDFVDALTIAAAAALIGMPLWAGWIAWTGGAEGLRYAGWLTWYGVLAAMAGLLSLARSTYLTLHPERRGGVLQSTCTLYDFREKYELSELATATPRAFCRLPGNQALQLSVEEKRLAVPKLPERMVGLKIAHLADLHMSGRLARQVYEEVVDLTNQWQPDLIAITGDLIEKDRCLPWIGATYARLRASHGVYFVLGNHDKKCSHTAIREQLVAAGLIDVGGKAVEVPTPRGPIELVGNELPWFAPAGEFSGADALRVVLAHGPDQFGWAAERGANLILAGHCHGGQVRFPLLGAVLTPSVHGTRYTCGVFRKKETLMHVTRGTGSLAPLRYLCPPELSLLTLDRG